MIEKVKSKKRVVDVQPRGRAYISTSYNNIIVSITNEKGDVIAWSSARKAKKDEFKNAKKRNTPYAGQVVATDCANLAIGYGVKSVDVFVKGTGTGREAAIRAIAEAGIEVLSITDKTPVPHGGCRPQKRRRN